MRGRDGYSFDGQRLRCEMAKGDRGGGRGGSEHCFPYLHLIISLMLFKTATFAVATNFRCFFALSTLQAGEMRDPEAPQEADAPSTEWW